MRCLVKERSVGRAMRSLQAAVPLSPLPARSAARAAAGRGGRTPGLPPAGRPPAPLAVRLSCSNGSPIAVPLAGL